MASMLEGGRLGRYENVEQLGRGGMATVFKAHDPALNRFVAIKVLTFLRADDPTFLERFNREAQAVARLNHPNILQVYDIGEDKGFTYIVTEYVPGGTLLDKAREPLSLGEALEILRPLAEALDYAHANGIIHRDIKPSNVLLKSDSEPVLADFGLSRVMEQVYHMTASQEVIGTPEYMSPEQALGRDIDHRSDLYAFGILAYQLLVGKVPYHANTPAATMMAHIHQPLPLPDTEDVCLDPGVKAVLLKAMAKSPEERYSTASEMVQALAPSAPQTPVEDGSEVEHSTMVLPTASSPETDRAASRRWTAAPLRVALVGLAFTGIIAAVVTGVFMMSNRESEGASQLTPSESASASAVNGTGSESEGLAGEPTASMPLAQALASYDDTIERVQRRVSSLRRLAPIQPIETNLETKDKLDSLADAHFKRRFLRDQIFEAEELYKVLGLLDDGDDLEEITREIFLQQVTALFDDSSGRLYVLSDASSLGPAEELSYSSVYLAGLQEQLFVVSDLRKKAQESGNQDRYRALTAFLSGDVAQIQQGYAQSFFSEREMSELLEPLSDNILASVPDVVRKSVLFPQREGSDFVALIYQSVGSWEGVNDVYSAPPVSTEQVIHPEKYLAREEPSLPVLPDLVAVYGRGWELLSRNTMGEFLLRTYLEQHIGDLDAYDAAAGWGGDRYVLMIGPEAEHVFALSVNWDTADDGAEFFQAYQEFVAARYGDTISTRSDEASEIWWVAPTETTFVRQNGDRTLLIIADDERLVERALSVFPAS